MLCVHLHALTDCEIELYQFIHCFITIQLKNALDLDQAALEDQLSMEDPFAFKKAESIYEFGGHSKSVANLKLSSPLAGSLKKFTAVSGKNADGGTVYGVVYDDYANGASTIGIQYKTTDIQSSYVECQVGGLVKTNLKGCLAAENTLYIDGQKLEYTYDPKTENVNKRTLKKLSTDAELKMYRCEDCPHPTYRKFREYYGHFDYADKWITAAFDGTSTQLARGNGKLADCNVILIFHERYHGFRKHTTPELGEDVLNQLIKPT